MYPYTHDLFVFVIVRQIGLVRKATGFLSARCQRIDTTDDLAGTSAAQSPGLRCVLHHNGTCLKDRTPQGNNALVCPAGDLFGEDVLRGSVREVVDAAGKAPAGKFIILGMPDILSACLFCVEHKSGV